MLLHYLVKYKCQQNKPLRTNYKVVLQATCLRCGGVVNNQVEKGLLLSVRVKKIWQSYKQERGCLMHFARLANKLLKTKKVHKTITFLLVTSSNIHRFNFSLTYSAINLS